MLEDKNSIAINIYRQTQLQIILLINLNTTPTTSIHGTYDLVTRPVQKWWTPNACKQLQRQVPAPVHILKGLSEPVALYPRDWWVRSYMQLPWIGVHQTRRLPTQGVLPWSRNPHLHLGHGSLKTRPRPEFFLDLGRFQDTMSYTSFWSSGFILNFIWKCVSVYYFYVD